MRILFVSPRQCWPVRSGAMAREYYFLRALSKTAHVDYVHFADPRAQSAAAEELPDIRNACQIVTAVPKPSMYTTGQTIRGVVGKWPLPILNYTNSLMTDAVRGLLARNRYDIIHVDSIHMMRCMESLDTPRVYNWHNIESEALRRFAKTVSSMARAWYANTTANKMERLEVGILTRDLGHVVCSERERIQLLAMYPRARIVVVENGVDTTFVTRSLSSLRRRSKEFVFVGRMDYYPNIEAAVSFATKIWPSVRNRMNDARLSIVGANPTDAVLNLSKIAGITVTGTVPNVFPYYENALAAIVPLRTGGGTRLKILEAMAAGVPVVSTALGAEGLDVTADTNILTADPDDDATWVNHFSRLWEKQAFAESLAANARELVKARYDWEIIGQKLTQTYQDWLNALI